MSSNLRMPQLTSATVAGNLTRDPELTYTATSTPMCKFGIAVNRRKRGTMRGDNDQEAMFIDVTHFGTMAENTAKLKKGAPVLVEGSFWLHEWTGNDNVKRMKLEINASRVHFLAWLEDSPATPKPAAAKARQEVQEPEMSEDIPF